MITVRNQTYDFSSVPIHYFDNNPLLSHFYTGLILNFPLGERMFVDSVRAVRDQISSPELLKDISGFIGQEVNHGRVHADFNKYAVETLNVNVDRFLEQQGKRIKRAQKNLPPKYMLAVTCGLEHFTAILGEHVLAHPELLDGVDPQIKAMSLWHAVEEIEHKSVAFDVYQTLFKDDNGIRKALMLYMTFKLFFHTLRATAYFTFFDKSARYQFGKHFVGMGRILVLAWKLTPTYMSYFKKDFHPNNVDSTDVLNIWREKLFIRI